MSYEKNVGISLLLDFYGQMLTDKQRETAELYYNEDLSLAEVSEITGVTRQGVRDRLVKAEAILCDYEEKLGLLARFTAMKNEIADIASLLRRRENGENVDIEELINRLKALQ